MYISTQIFVCARERLPEYRPEFRVFHGYCNRLSLLNVGSTKPDTCWEGTRFVIWKQASITEETVVKFILYGSKTVTTSNFR
jgi:hypothetical protein